MSQDARAFFPSEPHFTFHHNLKDEYFLSDSVRLLHNLVDCDFTKMISSYYVKTAFKKPHFQTWSKDNPAFELYGRNVDEFFNPKTQHKLCSKASRLVIKMEDIPVDMFPSIIETFDVDTRKRFKVVNLIRDPRAILNTRINRSRKSDGEDEPVSQQFKNKSDKLCKTLLRDVTGVKKLHQVQPDTYFMMRYEDLVLKPQETARMLFQRIGIPFTKREQKFLNAGTAFDNKHKKISREEALSRTTAWHHEMDSNKIAEIEANTNCSELLHQMHYGMLDIEDRKSEPLVGKFDHEPALITADEGEGDNQSERLMYASDFDTSLDARDARDQRKKTPVTLNSV